MKIAKASPEEVEALMNLMRVLNTAEDGIPCKPDGTWEEEEDRIYWFDPYDTEHLRKFYDRVTACFADHPGGLLRTIGGYHLAMTNDVFDPEADTYEWHPTLKEAVENRTASPENSNSASLKYRTSRRIKFACDDWGGRDETHLEIEWNGQTLMIDITEARIHIIGPCFDVQKDSVNAMDLTPTYPRQNTTHPTT